MTENFNSVPQPRATSFNPDWTSARRGRRPSPKTVAANRAKMAAYIEKVQRGEIKPLVISMGQRELY